MYFLQRSQGAKQVNFVFKQNVEKNIKIEKKKICYVKSSYANLSKKLATIRQVMRDINHSNTKPLQRSMHFYSFSNKPERVRRKRQ